jgi:hypothetical protein
MGTFLAASTCRPRVLAVGRGAARRGGTMATNCWEAKHCGREPGGIRVAELGTCPAATHAKANGMNHGRNGGRACWVIAGTLCGGKVQGSFAAKMVNCMECTFYKDVRLEEGPRFLASNEILRVLG